MRSNEIHSYNVCMNIIMSEPNTGGETDTIAGEQVNKSQMTDKQD